MTRSIRQALILGALLLIGTSASAQRVNAPNRGGGELAQHYLLVDQAGQWRHTSPAMGTLTLTLKADGTYQFAQVKDGKTKRLTGEYGFLDAPAGRRGTDLLLFSGPRAAKKTPSVRWSFVKSGNSVISLRNRIFQRIAA